MAQATHRATARRLAALAIAVFAPAAALAQSDPDTDETFALHGQFTAVEQYHPGFASAYRGSNSLDPGSRGDETLSATLYVGVRLWDGGQFYIDPEVDQGYGLSGTFGIAAFPSGEAYKVGSSTPYFRLQQTFFRQVIGLGGAAQTIDPDANQLGMSQSTDNVTITAGKFGVNSVFDTNAFAHDPSQDFMNWALIDAGAFDYAADSWGYSYGSSVEWTQSWWTLRSGFFAMSRTPNGPALQTDFRQYEVVGEAEARFDLIGGRQTKVKLLGFLNEARMGAYDDAVRLADATGGTPNTALVRRFNSRPGLSINIEQPLTDDLGAFLRAGFANGNMESYEFTDIDQSVSGGLALKGTGWGRSDDTVGLAGIVSGISTAARLYFADGGLGTLIGDGRLTHYAPEDVVETYYSARMTRWLTASADYQLVLDPGYNQDRGPVSIFSARVHAAF